MTYQFLLRHTPSFTALSDDQLRWTIDHSHEWAADSGAVISTCGEVAQTDADYWILLAGEWQLNYDGRAFASGHSDPGQWFSARDAHGAACSLVVTGHSYVMRITENDMREMQEKGFAFGPHLDAGRSYYRSIFGAGVPNKE